jgi:protein-disulfide isomerase
VKPAKSQGAKGAATATRAQPVRRARSKTPFFAVLTAIVVVGMAFIVYQGRQSTTKAITIDPNTPLPKAEGYVIGSPTAPVQVLEFADFECPACMSFATLTEPDVRKRLVETGKISMRYLDFPLDMHPNTWSASNAAACANEQGKFWEMHDQLFNTQDKWDGQATRRPKGFLKQLAGNIGLNVPQWETCFDSQKYRLNIRANQKEGEKRLVQSTPTFVIGSKMVTNALSFDSFKAYVDTAMASLPAPVPSGDTAKSKSK